MSMDYNSLPMTGWYPGHMLKAGRQMHQCLKLLDLVVELLDARIPASSRNPAFRRLLGSKPVFLVVNKADLADTAVSACWEAWYREQGEQTIFVDSTKAGGGVLGLVPAWQQAVARSRLERGATRPLNRALRVMIAGVPNVGKSTLVNRLVERRRTAVGPKPGVTRANEWVPLKGGVELLDTPGVLWPQLRNKEHELLLALAGSIRDEVVGVELLADFLWARLREQPDKVSWDLYDLSACPDTADGLLEAVGRRRGLLSGGGNVDRHRSAVALIGDFRGGRLGRLSLERPES